MLQTTRNSPLPELSVWAPLVLTILRIVSALLVFAGPGIWSLDGRIHPRPRHHTTEYDP